MSDKFSFASLFPQCFGGPQLLFDKCQFAGCMIETKEGKPFCFDHILNMPHANFIHDLVLQRDRHSAELASGKPVELESKIIKDLLKIVDVHGYSTIQRVSFASGFSHKVVRSYFEALLAGGILSSYVTRRGSLMVKLVYKFDSIDFSTNWSVSSFRPQDFACHLPKQNIKSYLFISGILPTPLPTLVG